MKYVKGFFKKYALESILAPLFKMLEALFDLLVPLVVARIINTGIANGDRSFILLHCAQLVIMALIGLLCSFTAQFFAARAATGTATGLRHRLFAHIRNLSFSQLDSIGRSTLITRMTSDIQQVQNGVNMFLRLFLRSPFIVFGAMLMALRVSGKVSLVFLCAVPVLFVIVIGVMRFTHPRYKKIQEKLDDVTGATRETLSGVRVIRAFGTQKRETEAFQQANAALVNMQLPTGRLSALLNPLTFVTVNLGIILILQLGGREIFGGSLLRGDVIALINYMSQILVELVKLANLVITISRAMASAHRIEEILDTAPAMSFPENGETESTGDTAVCFSHVCLQYTQGGDESLTDISFCAKRGETIGIIGSTGSGKTSLVHLLPRFYDATKGKITLLGHDICAWDKQALRTHVGIVMQKARLFSGTVRSNLLWGNEQATDEMLWEALTLAQAADFVRAMPLSLDAPIEQGGRNLSGGQRQRLTIARALVQKPEILILDDSASALDYATDAALRKAIAGLPGDMTVLIVSQRTASLQHADQIIVLEDGEMAGIGTHEALLASCPVYREIYDSQFKKEGQQP